MPPNGGTPLLQGEGRRVIVDGKDLMNDTVLKHPRHGREPTSRGRYEGQAARATKGTRPLYMFLRNEPTVFGGEMLWNIHLVKDLCGLQKAFAGGFVLENEPTGGVFLGGERRKVGSFAAKTTSRVCRRRQRRLVELGSVGLGLRITDDHERGHGRSRQAALRDHYAEGNLGP